MTNKNALKACPFCGSVARIIKGTHDNQEVFGIGCVNVECWAWMPQDPKLDELHNYSGGVWVEKDALIKAWNTRHQELVPLDAHELDMILTAYGINKVKPLRDFLMQRFGQPKSELDEKELHKIYFEYTHEMTPATAQFIKEICQRFSAGQSVNQKLREALKPLAELPFEDFYQHQKYPNSPIFQLQDKAITSYHVKQAREAIASTDEPKEPEWPQIKPCPKHGFELDEPHCQICYEMIIENKMRAACIAAWKKWSGK